MEPVFIYVECDTQTGDTYCYDTVEAMGREFTPGELRLLMEGKDLWFDDDIVVVNRCKLNSGPGLTK